MATAAKKKPTAKRSPTVHVSLGTFDQAWGAEPPVRVLRTNVISAFDPVTRRDYNPRGGTPLRDATADWIKHLDGLRGPDRVVVGMLADESGSMGGNEEAVVGGFNDFVAGLAEVETVDPESAGKVLCVVFTDGGENASNRVSAEALASLIKEREADGFSFIYMGANVDAWSVGSHMGLSSSASGQSVNFVSSPSGTRSAMGNVTARSSAFLSSNDSYASTYDSMPLSSIAEDGTETVAPVATEPAKSSVERTSDAQAAINSLMGRNK